MKTTQNVAKVSAQLLDGAAKTIRGAAKLAVYDRTGAIAQLTEVEGVVTEVATALRNAIDILDPSTEAGDSHSGDGSAAAEDLLGS